MKKFLIILILFCTTFLYAKGGGYSTEGKKEVYYNFKIYHEHYSKYNSNDRLYFIGCKKIWTNMGSVSCEEVEKNRWITFFGTMSVIKESGKYEYYE